jgi:hypothetical protein
MDSPLKFLTLRRSFIASHNGLPPLPSGALSLILVEEG